MPILWYKSKQPGQPADHSSLSYLPALVAAAFIHMFTLAVSVLAISQSDGNHISGDPRWLYVVPLLGLAASVCMATFAPWRSLAIVGSAICLLAATVFVVDSFNLLLDYDVWIQRGMPDRGQWHNPLE